MFCGVYFAVILELTYWAYSPLYKSMVSCQKGPTHHAYTWQIGPFWQDTLKAQSTIPTDPSECSSDTLP